MRMTRKQMTILVSKHAHLARKYSYLKKPRYIVKLQLMLKKQRAVLMFNQLIIFGLKDKDDKHGIRQHSKRFQKRCHVRSESKTAPKNSLPRPKRTSEAEIKKPVSDATTVEAASKTVGSSSIAIIPSEGIEDKDSTDNIRVLGSPERRDEAEKVPATTEDVNEQIREQLKLLQSGRRSSISLLTNSGNTTRASSVIGTKTPSCSSTPSYSRHPSHSSLENEPIRSADGQSKSTTASTSPQSIFSHKPKFIDSLISKLKTQGLNLPTSINDENQLLSAQSSPEKSTPNPPQKPLIEYESSIDNAVNDDHHSDHSTSSADVFLGFKEDEAQFERPNIPGMLPTPVVRKSKGVKSAFVSEALDNFMKENALDNNSYKTAPLKKRHDEAMMYAEAEPPSLLCPQLPSDVEKPRTVAEKRQLLERKADIKYLMIENESTVYRELRKRAKAGPVPNYTLIRNIQQMNIPFTRDCWRATCWLNTPNGRFYYQTIRDSGKDVKVMGGRGNNVVKELVTLKPMDKKKFARQGCSKTCKLIGNIKINGLEELITESTNQISETSFTSKKLNTLSDGYSFQKPGPLSLKKLNPIKSSIDVELGPLELYSLPVIQLEVWPKLDRPLPDAVHPYLKLALPHEKITPEWAEFALSTLKQSTHPPSRRKRKRTTTESSVDANRSFTFNIPYTNNQNRILVRKRRQMVPIKLAKLNSINETEEAELSFMKDVDKSDDVAVTVGDVLTGMIDSVALSLCEAAMVNDDPDADYGKVDGLVESGDGKAVGINAVHGKRKSTPDGKVVKELKKLNAKIIHGFNDSWVKKEECTSAFCRLGCICDSLRGAQTYSYHCKEVDCMFQCKCPSSKINTSTFESAVHNSDIKQFCDRMNASLAKEEKDFTATVVVSEGKTIYVPRWDEKKKRLKKVPKRLNDCVQFESDFVHRDLSETLLTKEENRVRASKTTDKVDRVDEHVLTASKNDIVKNMIHVNVNVERLNVLDDLEPLCMIHGLYKCFCRFRAIDGRRFEFNNSKIDVIEQPTYTKKRQYTFERSKDEPANKYTAATYCPDDDVDCSTCRRVRVVDTNHHSVINRVRLEAIHRKIKNIERDHPERKRLLDNRIKRCIAMPDVGQLVTVPDTCKDESRISNEHPSIAEMNKSGHSMGPDVMEPSTSSGVMTDANATKYRTRFNNIIMKTMHGISQKLKTMTTLPSPANKAFYYMQWKHFLTHFNTDRIYIWEVQLNTKEVLLVVTDKNIMPIVSNAMYVINIKAVSTDRLPLLPKLIKLGVLNEETEKLSILLFGVSNYWRVLGCTHSKNDFMNNKVVAIPTPDANPTLASKIALLFNDMVNLTAQNRSKTSTIPSNICIRKLDTSNIDKIRLPIPVIEKHRWYFMLSLANDFSHIYVPTWKQFMSHKKILLAIEHAKKMQRTVRWGPSNLMPQVYVSHISDMKIFFGPMVKNETLNLQLLQQHEGKMLLREDYQRMTQQTTNVNVTVGTWLYMRDDNQMVADNSQENRKLRTYPPQSKISPMKPSTSKSLGFIRLKPSTVTSNNLNITLMSPTSSEGFSNCTTSTPVASTSNNVPSSELVRQLSLGLRARPTKVLNNSNPETGSIKVVDTKLLMSPQFLGQSSPNPSSSTSTAPISNYSTEQDISSSIQAKPISLSFESNVESNSDWKDVSKGAAIRKRRFTTFGVSNNQPTLKVLLQQPNTSVADKPLTPNVQQGTTPIPTSNPSRIRERRYTTIISTDDKPLVTKSPFQRVIPPPNIKNFALVQNPGKKLTLTVKEPPSQLTLNRPVIIKKVGAGNAVTLQRSQSIDLLNPHKHRPLSPSNKQSNVRPSTSTSAIAAKHSSAPVVVMKPSSFNLNFPAKLSATSISLDGKSFVMKKSNPLPPTTFRILPSNVKKVVNSKPIKVESESTQFIDDDESSSASSPSTGTHNTINGYFISQVQDLGKIMAKKLFAAYSLHLPGGPKLFQSFKLCVDYLNKTYLQQQIFATVPANLIIEWKFVTSENSHSTYRLHDETTLRMSMVLTDSDLIDLNSDFHSNERFPLELRHHLLVLRLAHACMENHEARHKSGLDIVRRSEIFINELKKDGKKLKVARRALQIEKHLNSLKLNDLKRRSAAGTDTSCETPAKQQATEIITIDSEDE